MMVLGWILLGIAVVLAAAMVYSLVGVLIEQHRLQPRTVKPQLPWSMRRLNPVVPPAYRCPTTSRPIAATS